MSDHAPRIGYVLKRFPRFSETFILNELLALQEMGVQTGIWSLLTPPDEPRHARLADLRAPVTYLTDVAVPTAAPAAEDAALFAGQSAGSVARLIAKADHVAQAATRAGVSHLHAHFASDAATVALLAARSMGVTFSVTAHARDIYRTYVDPDTDRAKRRAKLLAAAFTVTVSEANADHLRAICPEAADRIHRLYNGIDLSLFSPAPVEGRIPWRIMAIGRLVEKKGFADLIDACALLGRAGHDLHCDIVGDGPLRAALAERIAAQGLDGRVRLIGSLPQERLVDELARVSAVALPCVVTEDGDRDGLPTVLLEAMARALPIVTTSVTGGPEIVRHGETGLVCPPGAPAALADALWSVLSNPARAAAWGAAGRRRAEGLFDLRRNVDTLARMFAATAAHHPRAEVA